MFVVDDAGCLGLLAWVGGLGVWEVVREVGLCM